MTRKFARLWIFLVLAFTGTAEMAHGQTGDPWLDSLDNAKGTIVGDLAPRFAPADQPSGGTPADQRGSPGVLTGPGTVNPSDPDTAGHIREWIDTAEPPPNATDGANFRYTYRGNMVGITADGGIITSPHETGTFDAVFLWQNRRALDSVDHCTLEEFVLARMAQNPVNACRGRYAAPPPFELLDFAGQSAKTARQTLAGKQLRVGIRQGDPAPAGELENTVAAQAPGPGALVRPGQSVTLTIYGEYAVPAGQREKIEQAITDCSFDEASGLIAAIDTDKARRPFSQRHDEAFAREETTKTLFADADRSYRSCNYEEAQKSLEGAAANTRCERYRTRIAEAGAKVTAAAEREATTRSLFGEADRLFKQADFDTALAKLNDARANTQCERYVSRIDEAIAKVEGSIRQPVIASQEETPPGGGAPPPSDGSYFVGSWAFSQQACAGTSPPPGQMDRPAPGSIGEAIEQGIEEAMTALLTSAQLKFDANGTLSLIGPEGETHIIGTWRTEGDMLVTRVDNEDNPTRIVEKRADSFVFSDPSSGENVTFFRCGTGQDVAGESAALPGDETDKLAGRWTQAKVRGLRIAGEADPDYELVIDISRVAGSSPPAFAGRAVRAGAFYEASPVGEQIIRFELLPVETERLNKPFFEVHGRSLYSRKIGDWQKLGRAYVEYNERLGRDTITGSITPWLRDAR